MAPNTSVMRRCFQYTGAAAVATLWSTLAAATAVTGFDLFGEEPISYLGTSAGGAPALFTFGLFVSALLLIAFHQFVRSRWPVGIGFSVAALVGLAGQLVAAFVPIGGEPGVHRIHTTSALILGISLPLLMWRFAASQPPGAWRRLCYGLLVAEVVACVMALYLSGRGVAPVAEILPAGVFHVWVLMLTFSAAARASAASPSGGEPAYRLLAAAGHTGRTGLLRRGPGPSVPPGSPTATASGRPRSSPALSQIGDHHGPIESLSPAGLNLTAPG